MALPEPIEIERYELAELVERLERIEVKLDRLVEVLERYEPLLELVEQRAGRRGLRWGGGARVRDDAREG